MGPVEGVADDWADLGKRLGQTGLETAKDAAAGAHEEVKADLRTLWVDYDDPSERCKEWRRVAQESHTEHFADFPLEGPPTQVHRCKRMLRHGGDPRMWLQLWQREKKLQATDKVGTRWKCSQTRCSTREATTR